MATGVAGGGEGVRRGPAMQFKEHDKSYRVSFDNGIQVEILKRGSEFAGIGHVKLRRRKLRSAGLPIMPLIRTPDGYEVSRLEFQDIERARGSVTVTLTPHVARYGRMEWVCCDGEDRWNVDSWGQPAERDRGGTLRLALQAVSRNIAGVDFVGFSYSYKFRSRKYRVYRIHDRATWELGGSAAGNSFWMDGPFNEPHKTFGNKGDSFTTAWCRPGGGPVQLQQFLPLFTMLQGFAFQFDRQNLLVTAFEAPFHCRSLFQKSAGHNHFVHWHQLCGDLSNCLEFPALQVLCADVPTDDLTERANQYCAIREELQRQFAEQCALTREGVVVSGRIAAVESSAAEALQRGLDELARAGCKRVFAPALMHTLGPRDDGAAPRPSPRQSEQDAYRRVAHFVEHAHQRGMEVAASLADCCAPWLLAATFAEQAAGGSADSQPDADGEELLARALRDKACGEFVRGHLRRVRRAVGVDAVFADSLLGGIADQFHWAGAAEAERPPGARAASPASADLEQDLGSIRSLHGPAVGLIAALQAMGYKCPLAGPGGLAAASARLSHGVLRGREFMFRDRVIEFPYEEVAASEVHPLEAYFRGCANRLSYAAVYDATRGATGRLASWWKQEYAAVNKAYHAVREHMEVSRLLPGDRGVVWTGPDPDVRVLWCYKSFVWSAGDGADAFDVTVSKRIALQEGQFAPQPLRVYLVQNATGP